MSLSRHEPGRGTETRVQVIERSLDLLETLEDGPRNLTQIARASGLAKGTAFRLLNGLAARDLVLKDPEGWYVLGPGLLRLVQDTFSGIGMIATLGRDALGDLADATSETAALHVQSGIDRVNVEEVAGPRAIRYSSLTGGVAPILNGSAGIVLVAFASDAHRALTLNEIKQSGVHFDRAEIEAQLARARQRGWAISVGERVPGATAISVPVQADGMLLALSVLGPADRLPERKLRGFLPSAQRTASLLAAALSRGGGVPPERG